MARGLDSDYIGSLSIMDGFDMGINFDGFGENMKKFMELPIKYLDSAHDKAVGLVEDIHALIYAPCPENELSNKGQGTSIDPSSSKPIPGSPPASVEMEQTNPDEELSSSPLSLLTAEDGSLCSTDTDAHETESVSSKSPDSCASEDTISLERTAGTKEELFLRSSENLPDICTPETCPVARLITVSSEEEIILWNPGNSVKPPQPPESSACDGAIPLKKITANSEEQPGLYSTNSHEESTEHDLFSGADDPNMLVDEITDFVNIDLRHAQERMEYGEAESSLVPQPENTSFKKVLMRSLSNKLRWSKKDKNVHHAVPIRPHEAVNVHYEIVSSSNGLDDDWELL